MKADGLLPVPPEVAAEHALGEPLACLTEAFTRSPITARTGWRSRVGLHGPGIPAAGPAGRTGRAGRFDLLEGARETAAVLRRHAHVRPSDPAVGKLDFDVVVEAAGSASALSLAGKLVAEHGTLVVIGYHTGPRESDPGLWYKGVTWSTASRRGARPDERRWPEVSR